MSEGVTVDTSSGSLSLSLSDGATATYDAGASNPAAGTLVFDYAVGANDYTTDLAVGGFELNGASIKDANGVAADFSRTAQYDLALDVNAAVLTGITASPHTGEVSTGQKVTLTLAMNEGVTINTASGAPMLFLNDGGTATYDAVASNPSAGTLVFDYTVADGERTPNLQVALVNLNGATINDANGNPADLSAAATFATNLQIGPAFASGVTTSQTGNVTAGQTVQVTVAMSEGVTVDITNGSPTVSLSDGAAASYDAAASKASAGTLVFDYTVGAKDYTSDLTVLGINLNAATIKDANGVSADLSGAANTDLALDVNAAAATGMTASPQNGEVSTGQKVTLTVTMSGPVTVNTGGGLPTLSLDDGGTATYDAKASNPSAGTLVFDYTVMGTDRTPRLSVAHANLNGATITDGNGNAADLSAVATFATNLQVGPAYVASVTAPQTGNVTTGQSVAVTVAMSEALTVDTSKGSPTLSLSDGATATYDATASNPFAGTLVFNYTVGANDYTRDLTVTGLNLNGAIIADGNGVNADLSGAAGADLALDVNAAVVTKVTASPAIGEADSGQKVTLTVTLSGPVTVNTTGGSPTLGLN
jgi:hypothetical protein